MQQALAHPCKAHEPEALVQGERVRLRVGHHPDAADLISLGQGHAQHVADERAPETEALRASIDTQTRELHHP